MLKIQKNIGYIIAIVGFLVVVINFLDEISQNTLFATLSKPSIFIVFLFSMIFLATAFFNYGVSRAIQVSILGLAGIIAIMDVYNSVNGLGLIILALFLSFKYGYFVKKPIYKISAVIVAVFLLIEIAARSQNKGQWMTGLDSILFLSMFLLITYIIYKDEIQAFIEKSKKSEIQIDKLNKEREKFKKKLKKLDQQIAEFEGLHKPVDIGMLSPREKEVLEYLCIYRSTDKDLAERLGIVEGTVGIHLQRIRDKLGVDSKIELIELCRNNFI